MYLTVKINSIEYEKKIMINGKLPLHFLFSSHSIPWNSIRLSTNLHYYFLTLKKHFSFQLDRYFWEKKKKKRPFVNEPVLLPRLQSRCENLLTDSLKSPVYSSGREGAAGTDKAQNCAKGKCRGIFPVEFSYCLMLPGSGVWLLTHQKDWESQRGGGVCVRER